MKCYTQLKKIEQQILQIKKRMAHLLFLMKENLKQDLIFNHIMKILKMLLAICLIGRNKYAK